MARPSRSKVVYRGEVLITEFDRDDLERLEAVLEEFIELEEGERLYTTFDGPNTLRVQKLREE